MMTNGSAKPCQRTKTDSPREGFTLSQSGASPAGAPARGGRPELENYTPVNIGNGLYCDNGEGVAATPLPYPLNDKDTHEMSKL